VAVWRWSRVRKRHQRHNEDGWIKEDGWRCVEIGAPKVTQAKLDTLKKFDELSIEQRADSDGPESQVETRRGNAIRMRESKM